MKTLLNQIRDRAAALTDPVLFNRRNPDGGATIDYHLNVEPARENDADLAPFCLILPRGFSSKERRIQRVEVVYCLHNENRAEALDDLDQLYTTVFPLSHPGGWTPWKLENFEGYFGDRETGFQPHPTYYCTFLIEFISNQTLRYSSPW